MKDTKLWNKIKTSAKDIQPDLDSIKKKLQKDKSINAVLSKLGNSPVSPVMGESVELDEAKGDMHGDFKSLHQVLTHHGWKKQSDGTYRHASKPGQFVQVGKQIGAKGMFWHNKDADKIPNDPYNRYKHTGMGRGTDDLHKYLKDLKESVHPMENKTSGDVIKPKKVKIPPRGKELAESIKVGDKIHLGFGAKGGAGFKGKVTKLDGNYVHIQSIEKNNLANPKTYKGPIKYATKIDEHISLFTKINNIIKKK